MKRFACLIGLAAFVASGLAQLAASKPVTTGAMTIIPILTTEKVNLSKYITLAEAAKRGLVEIVEVPGKEEVNALEVRNKATLPLLLLAGELLIGGKQDRIVGKDTIIPPHRSGRVPVFCVEHGRWQPGAREFKGGDTFVPDQVRQKIYGGGSVGRTQEEVWDEVSKVNQSAGKSPSTGTVRGTLDDPTIRLKAEQITAMLDRMLENSSRVVGMIVWLDGKILSADVFANHALFDQSRMKLLRSYALDLVLAKDAREIPVDIGACSRFLAKIISARRDLNGDVSLGNIYQIQGDGVVGYESGTKSFGGGAGGAARAGFGHGTYKPVGAGGRSSLLENLITNGGFSQGNAEFSAGLPYAAPGENQLWAHGYTIAPRFNSPQLHTLIAREEYAAPKRPNGNEQVFYANAGGTESLILWSTTVRCRPNTTYRLSFQSISLTEGREWIPTYEIRVNGDRSEPQPAGSGSYAEISTRWNSRSATSATVSIVRMPIPHGGGLIALASIEMVPFR